MCSWPTRSRLPAAAGRRCETSCRRQFNWPVFCAALALMAHLSAGGVPPPTFSRLAAIFWDMASRAEQEILTVAGREVPVSNPQKVLFPQAGHTKLDLVRYYLAVADGALRGAGGRPNVLVRYPERRRRRVLLSKARAAVPARLDRRRHAELSFGPHRGRSRAARRRGACLDGESRLSRAASASRARRRPRPSRRAARRSRPGAGRRLAAGSRGGAASCMRRWRTSAWSAGPRRRARAACTSTFASSPAGRSPRCVVRRWRSRARSNGARRRWPRASGGRKSGTACSSITTRTRRTARSPAAYSVRPGLTRACRRR